MQRAVPTLAMPMPSTLALGTYNPAHIPGPVLLAEFTPHGSSSLLDDLLAMLGANTARQTGRHALVVGPPGFGKTTSLHVLKHRVAADAKLGKAWVPLLFDEENYHIGDLTGFWLECLRLAEMALGRTGEVSHEALSTRRDLALESYARDAFKALLTQAKRRALLLVDNLDQVLAVMDDEKSQKRLRTVLREESQILVVGTAATSFDDVSLKGRPFHNLFRLFQLESFTVEEMKTALHAMADARADTSKHILRPTREGYWRGLHILTGGNPRLLKMIYHLMERRVPADFRVQLGELLDACTPGFKQRVESVSRQQQRVFDAIAHAWDSVQISDISAGLRMASNQISAQIQGLVDAQLIAITGGSVKRKRYQVADRFTNLCYFMRFSHSGCSRFEWFIRTMNILFAPDANADDLERLRELAAPRLEGGERRLHAQLLAQSLQAIEAESQRLGEGHKSVRHLLRAEQNEAPQDLPGIATTMELFAMEYDLVRHVANISAEQRSKLGYQHKSSTWWCIVASEAAKLNKTAFVEQCAKKAVELDPANAAAWGIRSAILLQKARPRDALEAAQAILKLAPDQAQRQLAQTMIMAAKHVLPDHRAESEKLALEMAMKAPGDLLSIMGFWCYLRTDVAACSQLLPILLTALGDPSVAADPQCGNAHFLALGVSATLLAAGLDAAVQEAIESAGVHEALATPLHAISLRRDDTLRAILAPERLALADAYVAEIEKRRGEMRRA